MQGGSQEAHGAHSGLRWRQGEDVPPFFLSNAAAVDLCSSILDGTIVELPDFFISEAVAVLIYRMLSSGDSRLGGKLSDAARVRAAYVILATLSRRQLAPLDRGKVDALRLRLLKKKPPGLHPALAYAVSHRGNLAEMRDMDPQEAEDYLLKQWDMVPLHFDFGAPDPCNAAGGGGGDPGGGNSAVAAAERPVAATYAELDPRTRALDEGLALFARHLLWTGKAACPERRAVCPADPPSTLVEMRGSLGLDVLAIVDSIVREHEMSHQAKRQVTFERQLVAARKALDEERKRRASAEVELVKLAKQPQRERRALEHERAEAAAFRAACAADAAATELQQKARLKAERAEAAQERLLLQKAAREASIEAEARITNLQTLNATLERQLRAERSKARAADREAGALLAATEAEKAEAEAEAARTRDHSRAWARVREEQARSERAEAARAELEARVEELEARLGSRDAARQAEHQELLTLRGRVKELRKKVEDYQARSNRRWMEVDPLMEENEGLRQQIEEHEAAHRQRLDELNEAHARAVHELNSQIAELRAVAVPSKRRFFVSGHFSAEVDLACICALQLGLSRGKACA